MLIFAPYIRIQEPTSLGPWLLIPVDDACDGRAPTIDPEAAANVARVFSPRDWLRRPGIFIEKVASPGATPDRGELEKLRLSLVVALLGDQGAVDLAGGRRTDAGLGAYSSDHAALMVIDERPDAPQTIATGGFVQHRLLGRLLDPATDYHLQPPPEIQDITLAAADFDLGLAFWHFIRHTSSEARRVIRATEWMDVSRRNSTSITADVRVISLRTGIEALFGTSSTERINPTVADLWGDLSPRCHRSTTRLGGLDTARKGWATTSDLEWWFTQFSQLRNAIIHGDEIAELDFLSDPVGDGSPGPHHIDVGEWVLRRSILLRIASAPELDWVADNLVNRMVDHGERIESIQAHYA